MAQAQEVRCLTKTQIDNTLNNWFNILNIKERKIIAQGKPVFSKENEEKWNLQHITKFADNYTVYRCIDKNNIINIFIIIETNKFDKLNISACCWYYHLFEDDIDRSLLRPQIFICPAFVVTEIMLLHVPINIIPCRYRFVSLCELYPLIGSSNELYGLTYDYKIVENVETYNGRVYSIMYDKDPVVKMLNALPGDIVEYKRVMFEGSPYTENYRREVVSTMNDVNVISPSGLCNGVSDEKINNDSQ